MCAFVRVRAHVARGIVTIEITGRDFTIEITGQYLDGDQYRQ